MSAAKSKPAKSGTKIDSLMEKASEALVERRYFECEKLSLDALNRAFEQHDFDRMARIVLPLQEARRQKRLAAIDTGELFRISEPIQEDSKIKPGCYLIEPPSVGADGRNLRDRANQQQAPVFVVVREPKTQMGLWPVVMIGPVTVRTKIKPPEGETPSIEWMIEANDALGNEAISEVDPTADAEDRVEDLLERLGTIVDHEILHQELEAACRDAARQQAEQQQTSKK